MIRAVLLFASVAATVSLLLEHPVGYATVILFMASNLVYFSKEVK